MAYHMYVFREGSSFGPTSTRPGVTCWQQELEREWKTSKLWGGCSLIQLDYDNVLAQPSILFLSWINKKQISSTKVFIFMSMQGRIKGGGATVAIAPGPPLQGGPPWWNLFVSDKILVWKISWFRSDTRKQLYIIFLCCIKYQGLTTATDFSTSLTFCHI